MLRKRTLVLTLLFILFIAAAIAARPAFHLYTTHLRDRGSFPSVAAGRIDDASHLNTTAVAEVVALSSDDVVALAQVRSIYAKAKLERRSVSIAGSRHSMGGQSLATNGIVLDIRAHDHTHYDRNSHDITVGAGATWDLIIPYLDRFGRAVEVMQSDSPFTVGGSISVNCHGWQPKRGPIASTVRAFTIITPDGSLKRCSRTENRELFELVLGGYGMFGVVLDVRLTTVPNVRLTRRSFRSDIDRFARDYAGSLTPRTELAFGRLSVAPESFLREAIITTYQRVDGEPPPLEWYEPSKIERLLFRGSLRNDYGKRLRWRAEKWLAPIHYRGTTTRNDVMDGATELYLNRSPEERDILQEYFVPPSKLDDFVAAARTIIPQHRGELLNVTVRDLQRDDVTVMRYAREELFAVVLFFSQRPTAADERSMRTMTRALIDAALRVGGTYYLPYRLHATSAQFRAAYPQCREFFEAKRTFDPEAILQNEWYRQYESSCRDESGAGGRAQKLLPMPAKNETSPSSAPSRR